MIFNIQNFIEISLSITYFYFIYTHVIYNIQTFNNPLSVQSRQKVYYSLIFLYIYEQMIRYIYI